MDPAWISLLSRARSGSFLHPPIGDEGSAGWQNGDPVPKTIILCDLPGLAGGVSPELPAFPEEFACVEELDLSGNGLTRLPPLASLRNLKRLYLGGAGPAENSGGQPNLLRSLPGDIDQLQYLEDLSVHDTKLEVLPGRLPDALRSLRVDRCPLRELPPLPPGLTTFHLEGCDLPGSYERPDLLPATVRELKKLEDLQLPDGSHMGIFFGTPLQEAVEAAAEKENDKRAQQSSQ